MNSNVKICAVPRCVNTSLNKPNKIFIHVPSNKTIRYKWLKLARRDPKSFKLSTNIYFCEDHFDLPNCMDNYMEYHVMGSVPQVRIKPGCIPTKFICQPDRRKRTSDDVTVRPFIIKKQRQTLIEEAIKDLEEQSTPTNPLEHEETTSVNPVVCEDIENNIHEHKTADKSIQVYITHKFRSKAIQTGIKFADQNTPNQEPPVTALEISVQIKEEQVSESERTAEGVVQSEPEANGDEIAGKPSEEWLDREQALLKRIEELEQIKTERSEDGLRLELKVREEEIDLLRSRVKNLETELQAALSKPAGKNQEIIQNIKQQHEELLSKARGMIFDKTKMVKNQELQIEALNNQVQSLKDINTITKDLLNIRNSEVKAMEDRLEAMEARYKAEKERHNLVLQRAQTSSGLNDDLKKEYETQLAIFKELRVKYEQRVQALVSENQQLKDLRKMTAASPNP